MQPETVSITRTAITLGLSHPTVHGAIVDVHDMHRLTMSMFKNWVPDGTEGPRAKIGLLWRYDVDLDTGTVSLRMQSKVAPDLSGLPRGATIGEPQTFSATLTVEHGTKWRYDMIVNPTRTSPPPGPGKRGTVFPLRHPKQQQAWLLHTEPRTGVAWERGDEDAATIRDFTDVDVRSVRCTQQPLPAAQSPGKGRHFRLERVRITGILTVTQPALFARTLTDGFGRARAYGCGLVLAAPL
jgi:CRISPR system Cascade subunit CasE